MIDKIVYEPSPYKPTPRDIEQGQTVYNILTDELWTRGRNDEIVKMKEIPAPITPGTQSNPNIIVNGGFQVWQRGTSYDYSASSGYHTADRMFGACSSDASKLRVSKSSFYGKEAIQFYSVTPPTDLTGSKYWAGLWYKFEGRDLYWIAKRGGIITISFWFYSNVAGEYSIALRNFTNTSAGVQSYVTSFNYTNANTQRKVEVTIPLNIIFNPPLQDDDNFGFDLNIGFINQGDFATSVKDTWQDASKITTTTAVDWTAAAGNFIRIAELKVEEGNTATPFQYPSYKDELLRCQRYFTKMTHDSLTYISKYSTAGYSVATIPHPVQMRNTPSYTIVENVTGLTRTYIKFNGTNTSIFYTGTTTGGAVITQFEADAEL